MRLYLGITKENELYYVEIENVTENKRYFAITGSTISPTTEEEETSNMKDMLSDGDFWRQAVETGQTKSSMKKWNEQFIIFDGWSSFSDLTGNKTEKDGETYYWKYLSGGQHQEKIGNMAHLFVSKEIFSKINNLWNEKHLKQEVQDLSSLEIIRQKEDQILIQSLDLINQ